MIRGFLRPKQKVDHHEAYPVINEDKLLFLGGLIGLTPVRLGQGNGQPLVEAAKVLKEDSARPDFDADAEFIERELFLSE